jgi:hypothetical protein
VSAVLRETFPSLTGEVRLVRALGEPSILDGKTALERRELVRLAILTKNLSAQPTGMRGDPEQLWRDRFAAEYGVPL